MVIAFISGTVINVNLIMEMSNMILQTIALLLLVFLCWLHEAGDKHMGFIIITICHIVAGTLFSWLPLTQGLYISHMTSQPECMVFQIAECLVSDCSVVEVILSWLLVLPASVHGILAAKPVGHHHALEAPFVAQHRCLQLLVFRSVDTVQVVV